jgi:hypothetical protein
MCTEHCDGINAPCQSHKPIEVMCMVRFLSLSSIDLWIRHIWFLPFSHLFVS